MLDFDLISDRGAVPARLHDIFLHMQEWCKNNHVPLHMCDLTRAILGYATDADYPVGIL